MAIGVDEEPSVQQVERKVGPMYPLARQVSEALLGAVFPLRRDHLVWVARENEAPPILLSMLSGLPDRIYRSLEDVQEVLDPELSRDAAKSD